jgi:hypothetical protein
MCALHVPCGRRSRGSFRTSVRRQSANGQVAPVTDAESMAEAEETAIGTLVVPRTERFVLAYHGIAKGEDAVELRRLAKSVTLEGD